MLIFSSYQIWWYNWLVICIFLGAKETLRNDMLCKGFDAIRTHEGGSVQHCPLLVIDGGHVLGVGLELPVELGGASSKYALQERRLQSWFKGLKF